VQAPVQALAFPRPPPKFEASRERIASVDVHADHVQDLQLEGDDSGENLSLENLSLLDAAVNVGLGSQIAGQLRTVPEGTFVKTIEVNDK